MNPLDWNKLRETSQKVGFKTITEKYFQMPDGSENSFTIWGQAGSINTAIIALTKDNHVVVARQYRPGPEAIFDEIPGGGVEEGEDNAVAAMRELLEETGYTSDEQPRSLGTTFRDGYSNDRPEYFLVRDCYKVGNQTLDAGEFVEVDEITVSELIENAKRGKMSDGVAVLMAYDELTSLLKTRRQ